MFFQWASLVVVAGRQMIELEWRRKGVVGRHIEGKVGGKAKVDVVRRYH